LSRSILVFDLLTCVSLLRRACRRQLDARSAAQYP
jgi:hypothetical protein